MHHTGGNRRFCRFWAAREGGLDDSLPTRVSPCRHILRAGTQGPRFESSHLTAVRSWPTYFSYLYFSSLLYFESKNPYSVVLWFLDNVCCKMCTYQLSNTAMRTGKREHAFWLWLFSLLPLRGCLAKGIWDAFMVPLRKSLDLYAGEEGDIIIVDL